MSLKTCFCGKKGNFCSLSCSHYCIKIKNKVNKVKKIKKKDAKFQSPKKSDMKWKRKCTSAIWKRSVRKRNRDAGLEYISQKSAQQVNALKCPKCPYKCSEKCTDDSSGQILTAYWAL